MLDIRCWVLAGILLSPGVWAAEALYGHLPYAEPSADALVTYQGVQLHRDMLPSLKKMQAAARKESVNLVVLSGFRSIKRQNYLFYGIAKKRGQTPVQRAKVSAPPGHSEHHTGFAIDFDDGDTPVRLEQTFADTKAGKWLAQHATAYGFEMSFSPNNKQGVLYEPWHWRWVGDAPRCTLFAAARTQHPAQPAVTCP